MKFSSNKILTIIFFILLWCFVTFFMFIIIIDTSFSIKAQIVAVILTTSLCLPFAWYTSQKLVPLYLYKKRISTFLFVEFVLMIFSTVSIFLFSGWVFHIITGVAIFRTLNISAFLMFVILFVNIIFTSITCVGKIIYDRYYIEEKMVEAVSEKILTEHLLIAEKNNKRQELKEQKEIERKRIASELHDNLGVQANAILHNSSLLNVETQDKNLVAALQETSKEMLLNLRETLWAMKATDVSAEDLWLRIINFMKQMGRHFTNINFIIEGEVPNDFIIASSQALHIVLVLQESINNSIKHANANSIIIKSVTNINVWNIILSDNGKGFEISDVTNKIDSYGLYNMQQRAKEGIFEYNITSVLEKGTITTLNITN